MAGNSPRSKASIRFSDSAAHLASTSPVSLHRDFPKGRRLTPLVPPVPVFGSRSEWMQGSCADLNLNRARVKIFMYPSYCSFTAAKHEIPVDFPSYFFSGALSSVVRELNRAGQAGNLSNRSN